MNVKQLRQLIKGLPPLMEVSLELADGSFCPVCKELSEIIEMEDELTGDRNYLLLLLPCTCDIEQSEIDLSFVDKAETLN